MTTMLCLLMMGLAVQEDVADIPSQDLRIDKDDHQRYFLIGPKKEARAPKKGYRLVVVLPGGGGGEGFHSFVKRITKHALSEKYIVAQPVAVKWTKEQKIVWPTRKNPAEKMKFSTEEFVEAVIKDVRARHTIDPRYIFTLTWSSSGPAAYAISLQETTSVTGSYIAMSVFRPKRLPSMEGAKGHAYFIEHSPDDKVCPFRMAEEARDTLKENGAEVEFVTTKGGHGWKGRIYDRMKRGIEWLEEKHAKPSKK